MISGHRHEGGTENGIRSSCENPQSVATLRQFKIDLYPIGSPDPVTLHGLHRIRPARHSIKSIKEFIRIGCDADEPLRYLAFLDYCA